MCATTGRPGRRWMRGATGGAGFPDPALIVQAGAGTIDSSDAQPVPPGP
jgi:hypothetical protein